MGEGPFAVYLCCLNLTQNEQAMLAWLDGRTIGENFFWMCFVGSVPYWGAWPIRQPRVGAVPM